MPINVLLVDDSAIIRGLMTKALSVHPDIEIPARAANGRMAITLAQELQPEIIILDIEMPEMDGITALPEILKVSPRSKIIMASTLTLRSAAISLKALELGATDYIAKPSAKFGDEVDVFYRELVQKVIALGGLPPLPESPPSPEAAAAPVAAAVSAPVSITPKPYPVFPPGSHLNPVPIAALAIATSTGGPQALVALFEQIRGHIKNVPIFITQHMPPTFTTILAEQLGKIGERTCREGRNGEVVVTGNVYLAPGNFHMVVTRNPDGQIAIQTNQDPPEHFCRPAADPMLRSLSQIYRNQLAVVVLTGMGLDGMNGAMQVVKNGGSVIAQDEASCIVYGMPKAVVENDLCKAVLPLSEIGAFLIEQIDGPPDA